MTGKEVEQYIAALDLRESVTAHFVVFAGMPPGEILGFQRRHISRDRRKAVVEQWIYRTQERVWRRELTGVGCTPS